MVALSAEATARLAAKAALDKNAENLVVLDLQGLSTVADFFIVCSARSTTQADTIVDAVRAALKAAGDLATRKAARRAAGCSWTTSTWSCTCFSKRLASSTRSSACGETRRSSPSRSGRGRAIDFPRRAW